LYGKNSSIPSDETASPESGPQAPPEDLAIGDAFL
jgi:hypothetical protein